MPSTARISFTSAPALAAGMQLAYSHVIGLEIGGGAVAAHFTALQDRCLNEAGLHCLLLNASFGAPAADQVGPVEAPTGHLRLLLPHDQVAPFADSLAARLPGEAPGLVRVARQSTTAEDLGQPVADAGQRMAQLQDYLTSLKSLGGRLTISVSDLVKIAAETAQAQAQIEAAQARQRELAQRVATEALDIDFIEARREVTPTDPVVQAWTDGRDIFRRNLGEAVRCGIAALPWLPLVLAGLLGLAVARVLLFGQRRR